MHCRAVLVRGLRDSFAHELHRSVDAVVNAVDHAIDEFVHERFGDLAIVKERLGAPMDDRKQGSPVARNATACTWDRKAHDR